MSPGWVTHWGRAGRALPCSWHRIGTALAPHWRVGAMWLREECSGISSLVSHSPGPPTCGNVIFASPGTSFQVKNKVSQQWKGNVCYHPLIRLGGDSNNSGRSRRGSAWHPCLAGKQKLHHQHGMGINITKKKKKRKIKPFFPLFEARSPQQALAKKGILFRGSERQDERGNLHFSAQPVSDMGK